MPAITGTISDPDFRRRRAKHAAAARTTPEHHLERIRELVARTRADQGLPPTVVDDLTLAQVANILTSVSLEHREVA